MNKGKRTRQATRLRTIYLDSMCQHGEEVGADFARLFMPTLSFPDRHGFYCEPTIVYFKYKNRKMRLYCQDHIYKEKEPYLHNYRDHWEIHLRGNIRYTKDIVQAFIYVVKADQDEEATKQHWKELLKCTAIRYAAVLIVVAHEKRAFESLKAKDFIQWRQKIKRMLPQSIDDRMKAVKIIHVDLNYAELEYRDEETYFKIDYDADESGITTPLAKRLVPFREGFEWLVSQYK